MRIQVRLLVVMGIVLFGSSLQSLVVSIIGGHLSALNLVLSIPGFVLSFLLVRKTCWLLFISALEERTLRRSEQRIQQHPEDVYAYLAKMRTVMRLVNYDCKRMRYFLAWDAAGEPAREITSRINKDLARFDVVLQVLETLDRLHLLGELERNSRTTPFEAGIASARLASFKQLFTLEREKAPLGPRGFPLVYMLEELSAAIGLNPLYSEAFACGADLMGYLNRDESANTFLHLGRQLEQALV